jgi:DNA-binding beta-propeller fold protein YncE
MDWTKIFARIAAMLLCLGASLAFAVTHPLNYPQGLAVDAKGNLYVANTDANQILVYDPSGQQLTARTITTNINFPQQLNFDEQGNLWVVDVSSGSESQEYFSEHAPNGKQINTAYTANSSHPSAFLAAFAVDGVGNLWTNGVDAQDNALLQVQNGPCAYNSGGVITRHPELYGLFTALAAHGPWIAMGSFYSVSWELVGSLLYGNPDLGHVAGSGNPGNGVIAMTFDNSSNLYYAAAPVLPINLGYRISGLVVDSIHGRLYISNARTNSIAVYSTSTWLQIGTIQ